MLLKVLRQKCDDWVKLKSADIRRKIKNLKGLNCRRKNFKAQGSKILSPCQDKEEVPETTEALVHMYGTSTLSSPCQDKEEAPETTEALVHMYGTSSLSSPCQNKEVLENAEPLVQRCGTFSLSSPCQDEDEVLEKTAALVHTYGSLRSAHDEYEILEFLGEGAYGQVAKCMKKGSRETVAVKICKLPFFQLFYSECKILRKVNSDDPDKFSFIRNVENFMYKETFFMAFEMMDKNLFDLIVQHDYQPFPMEGIRYVTKQLLMAQGKLRELHIIHGDLKPENIMLVNQKSEPFRIKIIDFGLSIQLPIDSYPVEFTTITYRAPEVMLGMEYNEAVDMWAVGCIVAEMFTGEVLYPGRSPYDQIRFIDELQGPFPRYMLRSNEVAAEYFCRVRNDDICDEWRVKTPREYRRQTGNKVTDLRVFDLENLDDLLKVCSSVRKVYKEDVVDRKNCIDMIKKMLEIDHEDRIFPYAALRCNFIKREKSSCHELCSDIDDFSSVV